VVITARRVRGCRPCGVVRMLASIAGRNLGRQVERATVGVMVSSNAQTKAERRRDNENHRDEQNPSYRAAQRSVAGCASRPKRHNKAVAAELARIEGFRLPRGGEATGLFSSWLRLRRGPTDVRIA
jgi:hypothetical protein